ncbi:exopolysaccharide production repressor protein [Rhizobiaceae bacterium n13]|uniref:Exopolysaccharide production repressor protein n=1 Tax=Ferirhizobium litorale TaxID=2927786 RepID=A0AAE3QEX0_9HYPH|nr:exopolysaccharide production repressor protein [Fererhizobium litorale]MDI7862055.1 exopolysaccharide production repressor protein [Fererhizobium litorale]MDI7922673.1 exopolysaccharide production repressor protein [Fererhizobium litorale]
MYAPQVFFSMLGALIVFAVGTYLLSGSVSTTLIQTLICAVLLQVGYFGAVLFLVWRDARLRQQERRGNPSMPDKIGDEKPAAGLRLSRLKKHGH